MDQLDHLKIMLSNLPEELLVQIIRWCLVELPTECNLFDHSAGYLAPRTPLTLVSKQFQRCVRDALSDLGKIFWRSDHRVNPFSEVDVNYLPLDSTLIFHEESEYQKYRETDWSSVLVNDGVIVGINDNQNCVRYHADPGCKIQTIMVYFGNGSKLITLNLEQEIISISSPNDYWHQQIDDDLPCHYVLDEFQRLIEDLFRYRLDQLLAILISNEFTLSGGVNRIREIISFVYTFQRRATPESFSEQVAFRSMLFWPRFNYGDAARELQSDLGEIINARHRRSLLSEPLTTHYSMAAGHQVIGRGLRFGTPEWDRVYSRADLIVSHEEPVWTEPIAEQAQGHVMRSALHDTLPMTEPREVVVEIRHVPTADTCCQLNRSIAHRCQCRCEMCSLHPSLEDRIRAENERKMANNARRSDRRGNRNRR